MEQARRRAQVRAAPVFLALMLWPVSLSAQQQGAVVHTTIPLPPPLPDEEADAQARLAAEQAQIVCRPPQRMTESRTLGPRVCRPKAVWDELHRQGLDISADGRGTVQSEKYRSIQTCGRGSC